MSGTSPGSKGNQVDAGERGKIVLISVNLLGSVSTLIMPPCCLTMMKPGAFACRLVVKNGLKIFSFTYSGMQIPLSLSTRSSRFLVIAAMLGS